MANFKLIAQVGVGVDAHSYLSLDYEVHLGDFLILFVDQLIAIVIFVVNAKLSGFQAGGDVDQEGFVCADALFGFGREESWKAVENVWKKVLVDNFGSDKGWKLMKAVTIFL